MSFQNFAPNEYVGFAKSFLKEDSFPQIVNVLEGEDPFGHYSITIDMQALMGHHPLFATMVLDHPESLIKYFEQAIQEMQHECINSNSNRANSSTNNWCQKEQVHARFEYLPPVGHNCKPNISCIRSSDVGHLLEIGGTVVRASTVKMFELEKTYRCSSARCNHEFVVHADLEQGGVMNVPTSCPSAVSSQRCKSTRFVPVEELTKVCDYQEVRVQEQVEHLDIGSIPRAIVIILQNDLVDVVKPGDDVAVVGSLLRRWVSRSNTIQYNTLPKFTWERESCFCPM